MIRPLLPGTLTPDLSAPCEEQLDRVRRLNREGRWGLGRSLLSCRVPSPEMLREREVLLLAVYLPERGGVSGIDRTFHAQWESIDPDGYAARSVGWRRGVRSLRTNRPHVPGARWVAYDYMANYDDCCTAKQLWERNDPDTLAASEVLTAYMLYSGYGCTGVPGMRDYSNLAAGYVVEHHHHGQPLMPWVRWSHICKSQFYIDPVDANWSSSTFNTRWAAPVVRELNL